MPQPWTLRLILVLKFDSPLPEDHRVNTLSTADSLRHHCKLGGGSDSIPGTSVYRRPKWGRKIVTMKPKSSINHGPDMATTASKTEVTLQEIAEAMKSASATAKAEGQLVAFLKTRGFSDRAAEYVTDTLGMYTMNDLKYPTIHMINEQLDEIDQWQKDLLIEF